MWGANKTITCYIEQKDETYKRYVVEGVSWHEKTAVNITDKGLLLNDFVAIRIPKEAVPDEFEPKKDMLIILGECKEEIGIDTTVAALKRKHKGAIAQSIHYNLDGQSPHWKVEAV